jgi:type IV pilus assembly protein PilO
VPIAAGKEREILDILPPLIGADFTLDAFVPLSEAEIKAAAPAPAPAAPPKK